MPIERDRCFPGDWAQSPELTYGTSTIVASGSVACQGQAHCALRIDAGRNGIAGCGIVPASVQGSSAASRNPWALTL
jgi:hypothetical protein